MRVIKRNTESEDVSFDKVLNRIRLLSTDLNVDYYDIAQKVCSRIYDNVHTYELDELAANICSSMIIENIDYGTLASRIIISNHHKNTSPSFSETVSLLYPDIINEKCYTAIMNNKEKLNNYIDYQRDYYFDFFGFKTLEKSYLLRKNGKIIERPQHLIMRVAIGIHGNDIKDALQTYDLISKKYFTHATPTLFNAGTLKPQLSSCYLLSINDDSIDGIFSSIHECASISKYAGGIGIHIHNVRAKNSLIRGTNGKSDGIAPMLKVFNHTARYVNQCFTPETLIYSRNGIKRMDEVTCEDYLLTKDSTYRKVNGIKVNKVDKTILKIKSQYSCEDVHVTDEHEILVFRDKKQQFILAKDLKKQDMIGYPIPQYENDIIHYNNDDCFFYGVMIANGYITKDMKEYGITTNKINTATFIKHYLDTRNIPYWDNKHNETHEHNIKWYDNSIISYKNLYDKNNKKYIHESFIHLPKEKNVQLLKGIFDNNENYFNTTSYHVFMTIRYLLLRYGILPSGFNKDDIYYLTINSDKIGYIRYDNIIWTFVEDISKVEYSGEVYDFNMTDNHNYTVSNLGIVHNSGRRAGSIAIYLEPWHADIFEFLELKKPHGNEEDRARDLFYAMWVPDLFMERVKNNEKWSLMCPDQCPGLSDNYGEKFKELYEHYESTNKYIKQIDAQQLWFKILESQIESGVPYICYKDACNLKSNQKNLGTIKSSNLCVAPETMILTDKGYYPIVDLVEQEVNVWNGKEFSKTVVKQTGTMQKLITIHFSNGMSIRCTPYHKFYIETGTDKSDIKVIEAKDLKMTMKIIRYSTHSIEFNEDLESAYADGLVSAENIYQENKLNIKSLSLIDNNIIVPINYNIKSRITWFEGLVDGSNIYLTELKAINLSSMNENFMKKIFYMLQTLGITSNIYESSTKIYTLIIDCSSVVQLINLGLSPKILDISNIKQPYLKTNKFVRVTAVLDNDECDDTYCFNEPLEHKGIFNGILTGNCSEIVQYSSPEEVAVCNLASICLPTYIENQVFNFEKLHEVVKIITKNLNKVIDVNFYPLEKCRVSNLRHRPVGIGIQGLADAYILMRYPFDSEEAKQLNILIFETIYHAAVEQSMEIAKTRHDMIQSSNDILNKISLNHNEFENISSNNKYLNYNEFDPLPDSKYPGAYASFDRSPASQGQLQFDLWKTIPSSGRYNWDKLKQDIIKYGMRNSLLISPMPTASTSQIMGFSESFEAITSNIYKRKTKAGEFVLVNKYLVKDLIKLNLWDSNIKNNIVLNDGSIQHITEIPEDIRALYKTTWEIKQKVIIDQAADRGVYICQSQSMNLFIADPDFQKLSSMHFYSWSKGLKTGVYYLRSKTQAKQQKFTIEPVNIKPNKVVCTDEVCTSCSG